MEPENDIVDKFTITDMLSDNLEYVTDLTNTYGQNAYGTGPIVAVIRHDRYSYGGTYDYIDNNNKSEVTVNGKKLTAVINLIDNSSVNVEFDVYYLVKVNDIKLDSMISDIENGTNINAMNEINTVTVKSDKKDEENSHHLSLKLNKTHKKIKILQSIRQLLFLFVVIIIAKNIDKQNGEKAS